MRILFKSKNNDYFPLLWILAFCMAMNEKKKLKKKMKYMSVKRECVRFFLVATSFSFILIVLELIKLVIIRYGL